MLKTEPKTKEKQNNNKNKHNLKIKKIYCHSKKYFSVTIKLNVQLLCFLSKYCKKKSVFWKYLTILFCILYFKCHKRAAMSTFRYSLQGYLVRNIITMAFFPPQKRSVKHTTTTNPARMRNCSAYMYMLCNNHNTNQSIAHEKRTPVNCCHQSAWASQRSNANASTEDWKFGGAWPYR